MKIKIHLILLILSLANLTIFSIPENIISIRQNSESEIIISVDPQTHIDYGFAFPLTYKFKLPQSYDDISVHKKYLNDQEWTSVPIVNMEYYNHHEIFRIDEDNNFLFISVGLSSQSDSIYLKAEVNNEIIDVEFIEITKYYDDRDMAVTASADDMAGWSKSKFETTIENFLQYNLYLTLGMNTNGMDGSTYNFVQNYINTGFIEAGAHSRTHPGWADYDDYDSEITGCKNDIINYLDMPELYRNGEHEYVYTWIAPNGYFDDIIDSLVGQNKMLVNRLYHNEFFDDFAKWNPESETYFPFTVTRAFDPPRSELGWGIGTNDIIDLNGKFDDVMEKGGVYHLMCHPNVMEWDKGYPWAHLEHISNRENAWYVALGHLYVYHLAQDNYVNLNVVNVAKSEEVPTNIQLLQNYPNPFNPSTTIKYNIPSPSTDGEMRKTKLVKLAVFDILGREIETLVNRVQSPGNYSVEFNAKNLTSGVYIYKLQVNDKALIKTMMYMK